MVHVYGCYVLFGKSKTDLVLLKQRVYIYIYIMFYCPMILGLTDCCDLCIYAAESAFESRLYTAQ